MNKFFLIIGMGLMALQYSEAALACSQPPPAYGQQDSLNKVLDSAEFRQALEAQVRSELYVSIQTVDFADAVNVNLTNGCTIKGFVEYGRPTHEGLCPKFKGVRTETVCGN